MSTYYGPSLFVASFLFGFVTVYSVTVETVHRNSTWLEAMSLCAGTDVEMPSHDYICTNKQVHSILDGNGILPAWLYGIEVRGNHANMQVSSQIPSYSALALCNAKNSYTATFAREEARRHCTDNGGGNFVVTDVRPFLHSDGATNLTYWVEQVDETSLVESKKFTVRCVLINKNGEIQTDDCRNRHAVACVKGTNFTLGPTIKYVVNTDVIPEYQNFTTSTPDAGTTPSATSVTSNLYPVSPSGDNYTLGPTTKYVVTEDVITKYQNFTTRTPDADAGMDADLLYAVIGAGVSVLLVVVVIVTCCCIWRSQPKKEKSGARLADGYSDTADSIIGMRELPRNGEGDGTYEDPDDALRGPRAMPRLSVAEGEYDILNTHSVVSAPLPQTGNAYCHVDILNMNSQNGDDCATYDVSSYTAKKHVILQQQTEANDTYGRLQIEN